MIIENPDAFKTWLTSILEPLCDADPAALAKYVYALVKKDKPLEELRDGMLDQLDVFLQHETKPFVDMLFKSLESSEHLRLGESRPPTPPPEQPSNEVEGATTINSVVPPVPEPQTNGADPPARARVVVGRARGAPPSAHPLAPRAPPNEHTLVKVLPTELLEEPMDQPPRRRDRRIDSGRDKDGRRRRSRSGSRRLRARRYHDDTRRYAHRRPSRSPSPRGRYRNRSPPPGLMERLNSKSRSRSPVLNSLRERDHERERDHDRERERARLPRELERDRMSRDREHRDRLSRSKDRERSRERSRDRSRGSRSPRDLRFELMDAYKRRCRDFDEKGYCMRGDLCQWDHGADPLVLEDAALSTVLTVPPAVPEYNPLAPDIWCGAPLAAPRAAPPRELVPIPRVRHEPPGVPPPPRVPHKKNFEYSRLGGVPRMPLPGHAANCSLEVKKVPRGMNDITHLNNHFSKFGKIVNIQVCLDGDPEAALITFSSPADASVAYKSTEAVLNNRFIKVFWHNHEKQENMPPPQQQPIKPADRQSHPMSHNKVLINRDNIKATSDIRQQEKAKEMANGGQELKKEIVKPADKSKQVMEMTKRGQALLETQLQQQMLLIEKLESGNVTGPQRAALLSAINSAQEGIEKLRKELVAYNGTLKQMQANTAKKPRTRQDAEKEILDAELDMFTKQQEGQDVADLLKKIMEMKKQMSIQFPTHHPVMRRGHSRGGRFSTVNRFSRGSGQKVFSVNQSVDHRPRALLISGFESDELEALIQHFSQFGEVTNKEVNLAVPELVLQYKIRGHAELAAANGRHYNDRTLSITWVANPKLVQSAASRNGEAPKNNHEPEPIQESTEDPLLRFDEEEEEEAEEDRSWRR